ncbi:arginyltransferase [Mesorhizobium australicum]|uniref:arginyltransferase n=1 Tax=Mesorhizobium australicum TaxID=536018 RepID=UPI00333D3203
MTHQPPSSPQFFLTAPTSCPYLDSHVERKVFVHLSDGKAVALNDQLSERGFRRSQNIAYRPACDGCRACVSVRIVVKDFVRTRSLQKVWLRHADLRHSRHRAEASREQFALFLRYIEARHSIGGMADMDALDYARMIEDTHVNTKLVEYRRPGGAGVAAGSSGVLVAAALTDVLADGLSMVYSFYDPSDQRGSLGTFMILEHIERARALGLPYLYLGYWIRGSRKMQYKTRFMPQEHLGPSGWKRY